MAWTVGTALQNGNYVIDAIAFQYPSKIYAATQIMTGKSVWLKSITAIDANCPSQADAVKAYITAIDTLSQLADTQQNILTPISAFQAEDELVLVQPAYPPTLAQYLAQAKPFTENQALYHLDQLFEAAQAVDQSKLPQVNLSPQSLRFDPDTRRLFITELLSPSSLSPKDLNDPLRPSPSTPETSFQHGANAKTAATLLIYLLTGVLSEVPVENQLALLRQHHPEISDGLISAIGTALRSSVNQALSFENQLALFSKSIEMAGSNLDQQLVSSQPVEEITTPKVTPQLSPKLPSFSYGHRDARPVKLQSVTEKKQSHPAIATTSPISTHSSTYPAQPPTTQSLKNRSSTNPSSSLPSPAVRSMPMMLSVAGVAGLIGIGFGGMLRFAAIPQTSRVRLSPEQAFPPDSNWPIQSEASDFSSYYDGPIETDPNSSAPILTSPVGSPPAQSADPIPAIPNESTFESDLPFGNAPSDTGIVERDIPNPEINDSSDPPSSADIPLKFPPTTETEPSSAGSAQPEAPVPAQPFPQDVPAPNNDAQVEPEAAIPPATAFPQASRSTDES